MHIQVMTRLDRWMTDNEWDDAKMAEAIGRDRSQVSRIRRGLSGASKDTALKLATITGIAWHHFIEPETVPDDVQ